MKSLLERVAAHTKSRAAPAKDAIKIFIIANRKEIQKTLDHRYDRKTIWETLKRMARSIAATPGFVKS